MNSRNKNILLVEDDENDVFFMQRAMQKANISFPMHVVMDGQAALDYLSGTGRYQDRNQYPLPDLMFLDLKLPYVHGFEVLSWVREHPVLSELPVIILTSSPEERDQRQAEELGVRSYCVKPPTRAMVLEAVAPLVEDFAAGSPSMR